MSPFRILYRCLFTLECGTLHLFGPGHLYEPCFYSDKYGMYVLRMYLNNTQDKIICSTYIHTYHQCWLATTVCSYVATYIHVLIMYPCICLYCNLSFCINNRIMGIVMVMLTKGIMECMYVCNTFYAYANI